MPVANDLKISKALTQFAVDFREQEDVYANMKIMPPFSSGAVKTTHYLGDKSKLRRPDGVKRAPGNDMANVDGQISQLNSTSEERSLISRIDKQERDNWEAGSLGPDQAHMAYVTDGLLQDKEAELASVMTAPANWTASHVVTPANLWDTASGNPADDIVGQMGLVRRSCQRKPNKFFISLDAWLKVQRNANIIEQVKHTSGVSVTEESFAALIGVDEVVVMAASTVATDEGQTDVVTDIWTKDAFLLYVPESLNGVVSGFGATREFEPLRGMREPTVSSKYDEVSAIWHYDHMFLNMDAGVFFDGVIS